MLVRLREKEIKKEVMKMIRYKKQRNENLDSKTMFKDTTTWFYKSYMVNNANKSRRVNVMKAVYKFRNHIEDWENCVGDYMIGYRK